MIDFMDRDDQEMVGFQRELLQLAADNHLTVTFHGVAAPTGLERTFPNLLNSEAVRNLEYDKWDEGRRNAGARRHRAAHADARWTARLSPGHAPRRAARAIQAKSCRAAGDRHADSDAGLVRRAAEPFADDGRLSVGLSPASAHTGHGRGASHLGRTRALSARVGEEIVIARRSGNDWWIGAMTDRHAREVRVPLSFLPAGMFQAEIYQDDLAAEHGFKRETRRSDADRRAQPSARRSGWRIDQVDSDSRTAAQVAAGVERRLRYPRPGQMGADRQQSADEPVNAGLSCRGKSASRTASWKSCPKTSRRAACRIAPVKSSVDWRSGWGDGKCGPNCRAAGACGPRSGYCPTGRGRPVARSTSWRIAVISRRSRPAPFIGRRGIPIRTNLSRSSSRRPSREELVSYSDGFHTFACEWVENQLRFYVDDMHHATFYNDEVGYFLPKLSAPMRLIDRYGDRRRLPASPGRDDGLAAAIARRLGARL